MLSLRSLGLGLIGLLFLPLPLAAQGGGGGAATPPAGPEGFATHDMDRPVGAWEAAARENPGFIAEEPPDPLTDPERTFLGEMLRGSDFVFVLDKSGSMRSRNVGFSPVSGSGGNMISNPTRWQVIQSETANAISAMRDRDTFDIVLFTSRISGVFRRSLVTADAAGKSAGVGWIYGHRAGGGTGFYSPLSHAFTQYDSSVVDSILFMTDGYPFDGSRTLGALPGWLNGAHAANSDFILKGYQIGGSSLNSFMRSLSGLSHTEVSLK